MDLLGLLTTGFLVAVVVAKGLSVERRWEQVAWGGLFLCGVPWLCLLLVGMTGQPLFMGLIPLLYLGVGGKLLHRLNRARQQENQDLEAVQGWRCPSCKTPNAAVNLVCYRCQNSRPNQ